MRDVTIQCDLCGERLPLDQGKEAMIEQGTNSYFLLDLCAPCLDEQLQNAESVNDADGYRQTQAALIKLRGGTEPLRRAS